MSRRPSARKSIQYNIKAVLAYVYSIPLTFIKRCTFLDEVKVKRSKTGMPRYIISKEGERLFTVRAHDCVPTISLKAATLLNECLPPPYARVIVNGEKIVYADLNLPKGVDAIIVDSYANLIGVGRTRVSGHLLIDLRITDVLVIRETVE